MFGLFILMVVTIIVALIWFPGLETREQHCVMEYYEDNMFRVEHVLHTIDTCETVEQLETVSNWARTIAGWMKEAMEELSPNSVYGTSVGAKLCAKVEKAIDDKMNALQ